MISTSAMTVSLFYTLECHARPSAGDKNLRAHACMLILSCNDEWTKTVSVFCHGIVCLRVNQLVGNHKSCVEKRLRLSCAGAAPLKVAYVRASLHLPHDHRLIVQNFTVQVCVFGAMGVGIDFFLWVHVR